jgi:hypothetical protein
LSAGRRIAQAASASGMRPVMERGEAEAAGGGQLHEFGDGPGVPP